jgi:hypothetical protein
MSTRIINAALIVSAMAFATGASIFSIDWMACITHHGGRACADARNQAATAWAALGVNALALVTNTHEERP